MSQQLYIHCNRCDRTWFALQLPADLSVVTKLRGQPCAVCHKSDQLYVATEEQAESVKQKAVK